MNERPIARGEMIAGVLEAGGERIPVNHARRDRFASAAMLRRQGGIKVVDFEISAERKIGKFAAGIAIEARPAVNGEGQGFDFDSDPDR
jgi:hypothetical protein